MRIILHDNTIIECTPDEYMELKKNGALPGGSASNTAEPREQSLADFIREGKSAFTPVYGCTVRMPVDSTETTKRST